MKGALWLLLCFGIAAEASSPRPRRDRFGSTEDLDRARIDELLALSRSMGGQQSPNGWEAIASNPQTAATRQALQAIALDAKEDWKRVAVLEALGTNRDAALLPFWKKLASNAALPPAQGAQVVRGLARSLDPEGPRLARSLLASSDNWVEAVLTAGSAADDFQEDRVEMPFTAADAVSLFADTRRSQRLRALALLHLENDPRGKELAAKALAEPKGELRWAGLLISRHDQPAHALVEVLASSVAGVRAEAARSIIWGTGNGHDRSPELCGKLAPLAADPKSVIAPWPGLVLLAGVCLDRAGELKAAETAYRRALAAAKAEGSGADPFSPIPEALMRLTRLAYLTGRDADARLTLDELRRQPRIPRFHVDLPNMSHLDGNDIPAALQRELDAPFRPRASVKGAELKLTLVNQTKERWTLAFSSKATTPKGYPGYLQGFVNGARAAYGSNSDRPSTLTLEPGGKLEFADKLTVLPVGKQRVDVVFDVKATSASGKVFDARLQALAQ